MQLTVKQVNDMNTKLNRLYKIESYMWNRLARTMPHDTFEDKLEIDSHPYMLAIQDLIDIEEEISNE